MAEDVSIIPSSNPFSHLVTILQRSPELLVDLCLLPSGQDNCNNSDNATNEFLIIHRLLNSISTDSTLISSFLYACIQKGLHDHPADGYLTIDNTIRRLSPPTSPTNIENNSGSNNNFKENITN